MKLTITPKENIKKEVTIDSVRVGTIFIKQTDKGEIIAMKTGEAQEKHGLGTAILIACVILYSDDEFVTGELYYLNRYRTIEVIKDSIITIDV